MARFKFRFDKLLLIREHEEQEAKMGYLSALAQELQAEAATNNARRLLDVKTAEQVTSFEQRLGRETYLQRLEDELAAAMLLENMLKDAADAALGTYQSAKQEAEKLRKLRESAHAEWTLEESHREQVELDEWATMNWRRA